MSAGSGLGSTTISLGLDDKEFRRALFDTWRYSYMKGGEIGKGLGAGLLTRFGVHGGVAAALVTGLTAVSQSAAKTETEFTMLGNTLGLTKAQMKLVQEQIMDLAVGTGVSLQELSDGLSVVARSGFNAADSIKIMSEAAKVSRATFSDASLTADTLVDMMQGFGIGAKDAGRAANALFEIMTHSQMDINGLQVVMGNLAGSIGATGTDLEAFASVLVAMGSKGLRPAHTLTIMRGLLKSFIDPTDDAVAAANKLGIELDTTAIQGRGLLDVLHLLKNASDEDIAALTGRVVDVAHLRRVIKDLTSAELVYQNLQQGSPKLAEAEVAALDTLTAKYQQLEQQLTRTGKVWGDIVNPAAKGFLDILREVVALLSMDPTGNIIPTAKDLATYNPPKTDADRNAMQVEMRKRVSKANPEGWSDLGLARLAGPGYKSNSSTSGLFGHGYRPAQTSGSGPQAQSLDSFLEQIRKFGAPPNLKKNLATYTEIKEKLDTALQEAIEERTLESAHDSIDMIRSNIMAEMKKAPSQRNEQELGRLAEEWRKYTDILSKGGAREQRLKLKELETAYQKAMGQNLPKEMEEQLTATFEAIKREIESSPTEAARNAARLNDQLKDMLEKQVKEKKAHMDSRDPFSSLFRSMSPVGIMRGVSAPGVAERTAVGQRNRMIHELQLLKAEMRKFTAHGAFGLAV